MRKDDPSQGGELTKPASFDKNRWENLDSILKMYNAIGKKSAATTEQTVNFELHDPTAKGIVQFFLNKIITDKAAHPTVVSDWILVNAANKPFACSIDLKTAAAFTRFQEQDARRTDPIDKTLKFVCKGSQTVPADVYYSIIKAESGTGTIHAVQRTGKPEQSNSSQAIVPLFAGHA